MESSWLLPGAAIFECPILASKGFLCFWGFCRPPFGLTLAAASRAVASESWTAYFIVLANDLFVCFFGC